MKCFLGLAPLFIYVSGSVAKDNDKLLTLAFVEGQALDSLFKTKTANAELGAAQNKAETQQSLLHPKPTPEGTYKYITEAPTLKFSGGTTTPFGDHQNYSIGPRRMASV